MVFIDWFSSFNFRRPNLDFCHLNSPQIVNLNEHQYVLNVLEKLHWVEKKLLLYY